MSEYYEKIAIKINQPATSRQSVAYDDRYYIQKKVPFFVDYEVYYEITFTRANDNASKFDRIIAFTKIDISPYYAVKLFVSNDIIKIHDKEMPVQIIDDWKVSIRPCELNNFADIFGEHPKIGGTREYYDLMRFLTATGLNLVEIIDFSDHIYAKIKHQVTKNARVKHFFNILDKCRELVMKDKPGKNVIRYLLLKLNNRIIKRQRSSDACHRLSNLFLEYGCIPFDEMPYNTSLKNHNPRLRDLFECLDWSNRVHELFARHIKNNTEIKGQLYTPEKEITNFENINSLIQTYNGSLYYKHTNRRLKKYKGHIYIKGYEKDTHQIINNLKKLASKGIRNYSNSIKSWLQISSYNIDCYEKRKAIRDLFEQSKVALIYGSAGTGKTTMINHISNFFKDKKKLYLSNTNPAVDNLKRRVNAANCTFKTIAKFLYSKIMILIYWL